MMDESIERLLDYWFAPEPETQQALDQRFKRWFITNAEVDSDIASRFRSDAERAARGELHGWSGSAKGRLALILLLDQVPRHLYRGTAAAFEQDAKALALTVEGIEAGLDLELPALQRGFFYMPLQHAETIDVQELSVRQFDALRGDATAPKHARKALDDFAAYARMHRDILARFGRFPHRNRALGRQETAAERQFLGDGGPSFGQ